MSVKAYSYIRFSSDKQMKGDSIRRQTQAANEWAMRKGIAIDETIHDLGISGYRGQNRILGALADFLKLVEDGRIPRGSYLIVESLDRLSREAVLVVLPQFIALVNAGIVIVTLIDGQEYSREGLQENWSQLLISLTVMARAHEESRTKSMRIAAAWQKKRDSASEKPLTARLPGWLTMTVKADGSRKIDVINERAAIVQRIFRELAEGKGARTVASMLNKEGVPPFGKGNGWHKSYVLKLVSNPAVIGDYQSRVRNEKGEKIDSGPINKGYFPAIISEGDYYLTQQHVQKRKQFAGRRGPKIVNLLTGLLRCGVCGSRMSLINKGEPPKGGRYYYCSAADRMMGCTNRQRWRRELVEDNVLQRLRGRHIADILKEDEQDNIRDQALVFAEELRAKIAHLQKNIERWTKMFESDDDDAAERIKVLRNERKLAEKELLSVEKQISASSSTPKPSVTLRTLQELTKVLEQADDDAVADIRRRMAHCIRQLFKAIIVSPDYITGQMVLKRSDWMAQASRPTVSVFTGHNAPEAVATVSIIDRRPETLAMLEQHARENEESVERDME